MTDRQLTVLVVDDKPLVRAADSSRFDVLKAADAEEAMFYLAEYPSLRLPVIFLLREF